MFDQAIKSYDEISYVSLNMLISERTKLEHIEIQDKLFKKILDEKSYKEYLEKRDWYVLSHIKEFLKHYLIITFDYEYKPNKYFIANKVPKCNLCNKNLIVYFCPKCGRNVCERCTNTTSGLCSKCFCEDEFL